VVDVPPRTVAHEGPVYHRPLARPDWQDTLQADVPDALPRPASAEELRATLLRLVGSSNLADRSWVTDQYDRYVLGNTVLAQPDDAGMVRLADDSTLGVALATDCNGRFTKLDPYTGTQLALAEAYRNVAVSGARPLAVTDCLNFGSPEDPAVMWQFEQATQGLADACRILGLPVTGGNVSFYNQTGEQAILPTPVVGVLGVTDDVTRRLRQGWSTPGSALYLLGTTEPEFGGSEWAHVVHGHLGGLPPRVDLEAERRLADVLVDAAADGLVRAAHDLSDGGLAQALVEGSLRAGHGVDVVLPGGADPFVALFSESAARAVVEVGPEEEARFVELCERAGVPVARIGTVGSSGADATLKVDGLFDVPLDELRTAWARPLPELFES
jgi:phosphoribosylformylglycinamidine synthase subunit PurL